MRTCFISSFVAWYWTPKAAPHLLVHQVDCLLILVGMRKWQEFLEIVVCQQEGLEVANEGSPSDQWHQEGLLVCLEEGCHHLVGQKAVEEAWEGLFKSDQTN